jgi:hypothetical protein
MTTAVRVHFIHPGENGNPEYIYLVSSHVHITANTRHHRHIAIIYYPILHYYSQPYTHHC